MRCRVGTRALRIRVERRGKACGDVEWVSRRGAEGFGLRFTIRLPWTTVVLASDEAGDLNDVY